MIRPILIGPAMAIAFLITAAVAPAIAQEKVTAELVADTTAIAAKPFTVAVHLTIADGWHVYWLNPGDAGAATTFKITAPPGFSVGAVDYPVPEKLPQPGGLTVYAYQKELVLTARITPPPNLIVTRSVHISAAAGWCVCSDVCILGKKKLDLLLPAGAALPANQDLFSHWGQRMPLESSDAFDKTEFSGDLKSAGPKAGWDCTLKCHWKNAPPPGRLEWLPGPSDDLNIAANSITTVGQWTSVKLNIQSIEGISPTASTITGLLAYYEPGKPPRGVGLVIDRKSLNLPAAK